MTTIINSKNSKEIQNFLKNRKVSNSGNLKKYFGILKRNIDGLKFQTEIRKNEDFLFF